MGESTNRDCRYCGTPIADDNGRRGEWKRYCNSECREQGRLASQAARRARRPPCSIAGCERLARSAVASYCEAHYYRLRRTGSLSLEQRIAQPAKPREQRIAQPAKPREWVDGRGYARIANSTHPLATETGGVAAHRAIAYDDRDGKCSACEWCGLPLTWETAVVDHVDDNKTNNDPANLVISCHQCNAARGQCSARRFAEGVAVRVLCRLYADQRSEIVEEVMSAWVDRGGRLTADDLERKRVKIHLLGSDVQPKGARGR